MTKNLMPIILQTKKYSQNARVETGVQALLI